MQKLQCPCEKALFSDFARYGAYTRVVKCDILYSEVPSSFLVNTVRTLSKSVYNCQSYWQKFRGTFFMAHCVHRPIQCTGL